MRIILAALLLACESAFAQDPDSVKAPFIEAGDCWSYRGSGIHNRGPVDDYELCVTRVDFDKKLIQAVATVRSDGREIDTLYTLQWGEARAVTGQISTPPSEFLRFPLRVGDKFTVKYDYRGPVSNYVEGYQDFRVAVEGWEEVVVPAGKFRAVKIVAHGTVTVPASNRSGQMTKIWWYVPQFNRYVKHSVVSMPNTYSEELTGYRPLK